MATLFATIARTLPYSQKFFTKRKCFSNFTTYLLSLMKFLIREFFDDYIEDMVTFTALAKVYFAEYFCNTKVAGFGEIFGYTVIASDVYVVPKLV